MSETDPEIANMYRDRQSALQADKARADELELLLGNESIQAGIRAADAKIAAHWQELKQAGKHVSRLADGVTLSGNRVVVAEYADVPNPATTHDGDWSTWHQTHKYSVFAFPLRDAMSPHFSETLAERESEVGLFFRGGGISIQVADPDSGRTIDLHLPQRENDEPSYDGEVIRPLPK